MKIEIRRKNEEIPRVSKRGKEGPKHRNQEYQTNHQRAQIIKNFAYFFSHKFHHRDTENTENTEKKIRESHRFRVEVSHSHKDRHRISTDPLLSLQLDPFS